MLSFTQFITEDFDIVTHFSQTKERVGPTTHGVVGFGAVKDKSGKTHADVFHHSNGHTYIRHQGMTFKSNKPVHHSSKEIAKSLAYNEGEEDGYYKGI